VTSYHLRGASPAKTRADAVVVGAWKNARGATLADGSEDVTSAFGRSLRPLLSTLGFTGKAGEVARVPTGGSISIHCALRDRETEVSSRRRRKGWRTTST